MAGSDVCMAEGDSVLVVCGNPLEGITVTGGSPEWCDADPRRLNIPTIWIIIKDGGLDENTFRDWTPEYVRKPDPAGVRQAGQSEY